MMPNMMLALRLVAAAVAVLVVIAVAAFIVQLRRGDPATPPPDYQAIAASFDGFPVLWLGPSYDTDRDGVPDLYLSSAAASHVAAVMSSDGQVIRPDADTFTLTYSTCGPATTPDESPCETPLTIVASPPETGLPTDLSHYFGANVRGVGVRRRWGGDFFVHTSRFTVEIIDIGATPEASFNDALNAAYALIGANTLASGITRTSLLTANPIPSPSNSPLPASTRP